MSARYLSSLHILFLSDNFPPESNAPATRLFEHASHWVRIGHRVTIITCAPNFPEGKLYSGYRNRWYSVEQICGIRVVRVKTYITANQGFVKRTLDYMSFMVSGFTAGLIQDKPDLVVSTSPQFFCAVGGWLVAAVRRKPFVFELRDLWPASIVAVGAMKRTWIIRWLEKLELFLYRRAAAVIAVTPAYKVDLVRRGITPGKIGVVMNGVDLARYAPCPRDLELASRFDVRDKFVVGYLGTHGLAHGLHSVLETAKQLRNRRDIVFLFVGSGAARDSLIHIVEREGLTNVRMLPLQPKNMMPSLWSLCDIALIPLKNDPLFATVIPSKIFEAMGVGVPVVLSLPEGEATDLVRNTGIGIAVPPERPSSLAAAILDLYENPLKVSALRQAGLSAAPQFSRAHQAENMLAVFHAVAEGNGDLPAMQPP